MRTNLTCEGCFLYKSDINTALIPTDLPCPVAPAISNCGIFAKSATNTSLEIVFPSAIGKSIFARLNLSDISTSLIETICFFLLGTSIPIVPFPGIGAMIRMPSAERLRAISSSRFLILEIRTPGAGIISYKVTVGPIVARILMISIL